MSVKPQKIKLGTRGSPLALRQSEIVQHALKAAHPDLEVEQVIITTSGDWRPSDGEVRLKEVDGGKGQFAKEIEQALLGGAIDIAVHSMKDMETTLPMGLRIAHMLPREDVRDALLINNLANNSHNFDAIPKGVTVGTASVRRQAFLLAQRPDLNVVPIRGNVETRIEKTRTGQVDATFLALAGLNRLGLSGHADIVLDPEIMLPSAGQGAVGIETREKDLGIAALLDAISCVETCLCVTAERAVLSVLDGSCHTPVGVYAKRAEDGSMHVQARLCSLDGKEQYEAEKSAAVSDVDDAQTLGAAVGHELKSLVPPAMLEQMIDDDA